MRSDLYCTWLKIVQRLDQKSKRWRGFELENCSLLIKHYPNRKVLEIFHLISHQNTFYKGLVVNCGQFWRDFLLRYNIIVSFNFRTKDALTNRTKRTIERFELLNQSDKNFHPVRSVVRYCQVIVVEEYLSDLNYEFQQFLNSYIFDFCQWLKDENGAPGTNIKLQQS